MSEPKRIQRKRTRGYKMPPGCVYVGRPSKWGNPFVVGEAPPSWGRKFTSKAIISTPGEAVAAFRRALAAEMARGDSGSDMTIDMVIGLRGKTLACFCPLDQPCHADVLLEIANAPRDTTG